MRILDTSLREKTLAKIIEDGLNVTKSEELIEQIISNEPKKAKARPTSRDTRSFFSAIDRLISSVRLSGVEIKSRVVESDEFTEVTILVPNGAK